MPRLVEYVTAMHDLEFRKATAALRSLWSEGNIYLEAREPWKTVKSDRDRTACTLRTALQLAVLYSVASAPFIPFASARLAQAFPDVEFGALTLDAGLRSLAAASLRSGDAFVGPGLLFDKFTPEALDALAERFGGAEAPAGSVAGGQ